MPSFNLLWATALLEPVRIVFLPAPAVGSHSFQVVFRFPAEFFERERAIRIAFGDIARSSGSNPVIDRLTHYLSESLYHLQNAVAFTRTQIIYYKAATGMQLVDGGKMSLGQVDNVNIISDARSVGGGIIVSAHVQTRQFPDGHLRDIRNEVVGNTVGVLAYKPAFVRAYGIKVPQQGDIERVVGFLNVFEYEFFTPNSFMHSISAMVE